MFQSILSAGSNVSFLHIFYIIVDFKLHYMDATESNSSVYKLT